MGVICVVSDRHVKDQLKQSFGLDRDPNIVLPDDWPAKFSLMPIYIVASPQNSDAGSEIKLFPLEFKATLPEGTSEEFGVWLDKNNELVLLTSKEARDLVRQQTKDILAKEPDSSDAAGRLLYEKARELRNAALTVSRTGADAQFDLDKVKIKRYGESPSPGESDKAPIVLDETPLQILSGSMIEHYGIGIPGAEQEGLSVGQQVALMDQWLPKLEEAGMDFSSAKFQELIKDVRKQEIVPGVNDIPAKTAEERALEAKQAEISRQQAQLAGQQKAQAGAPVMTAKQLGKMMKGLAQDAHKSGVQAGKDLEEEAAKINLDDYVGEDARLSLAEYAEYLSDQIGKIDFSSLSGQFNALSNYQQALITKITKDMEGKGVDFKNPELVREYFKRDSDLVEGKMAEAVETILVDAAKIAKKALQAIDHPKSQPPSQENDAGPPPGGPGGGP